MRHAKPGAVKRKQVLLKNIHRMEEENGFPIQLHMRESKPHEAILKAAKGWELT